MFFINQENSTKKDNLCTNKYPKSRLENRLFAGEKQLYRLNIFKDSGLP